VWGFESPSWHQFSTLLCPLPALSAERIGAPIGLRKLYGEVA